MCGGDANAGNIFRMFLPAAILKSYFPFDGFFYSITIQFDAALLQLYSNQFRKPLFETIEVYCS